MNFSLKRWLNDSDKPVRASFQPRKLSIETLEDRTTPSITIPNVADATPAVTVANSSQSAIAGGYDPQEVLNPSNHNQVVSVSTTGSGLQFSVSNNLGQSWSTQAASVNLLTDPTTLGWNGFNGYSSPFSVIDAPSMAMDTNNNIYVAYIQRNATYSTSGALVVDKFTVNSSGIVSAVPNSQNVLYRWVGQDPVFNPVVGVNNLVSSFTDPTTNQTTINPNINRGVFVAWNTNATQSGNGNIITPSVIQLAVSDNGGASFSTPQFLTNNGFFSGVSGVLPQLYFTQSSVQNAITGGKLGIAWLQGGSTLTNNTYSLPSAGTPLTVQQTVKASGTALGDIAGAFTPPNGVLTRAVTQFSQNVTINAANFTTLADLSVTLSVFSQDLSQMSIQLVSSTGVTINLLSARQVLDNNGALQTPDPNAGLPGGGVGGLGEETLAIGGSQYYHPATGVTFDDNGARAINDPANVSPYIITVRPEYNFFRGQRLSDLNGLTAAQLSGTWTLIITNYKANDNGTPPITAPRLDQWDMKFVSRVQTSGFGSSNGTGASTAATTATNVGAATTASPLVGVQGWYSVAVDTSAGSYSPYQGRIYMAYTGDGGNDTNIYLISSSDGGSTWSRPVQVNDDSPSDGFSTGTRAQFQPTVTVDPTTGTVIVMWYDARWDASNARPATFMATSVDGGRTFSPNTFINATKAALNAIDRSTVKIEPVPNNLASMANGFGDHQGLVAYGGTIVPLWTGNANDSGTSSLMTASVVTAAGPRILQGDMGPVSDTFVDPNNANITYNNTFALDGTRLLTAFYVRFDRYVDPTTFTAADVQLMYQSTTGAAMVDISSQVLSVTALNTGTYGATQFLVTIAPQSAVGTYSYAIGPDISDRIRHDGLLGNKMDQNANGVSGQTTGVDSFANPTPTGGVPFVLPYATNSLPLIIPGPRVISSTPGTTFNGSVSYIDVTFDRDMLASSFTPSQVIELLTPLGTAITSGFTVTANPPGTSAANAHRTFRVSFATQTVSGNYSLVLGAGITSITGYKMDSNMNAGVDILTGRVVSPTLAGTFLNQINTGNVSVTIPPATNSTTPSVATSVLNIPNSYIITQLLATPIQLRLDITFPDVRNISAELVAPDGVTTIKLFTNVGQYGVTTFSNFTNTVFSDFAPANNTIQTGSAPFTNGPFLPQQQLSVLDGVSAKGNWTLRITNTSTSLSGMLNYWGLSLPEAILGSGLGETVADQTTVAFKVFTTNASNPLSSTNWTSIGSGTSVDKRSGDTSVGNVTVTAVDPSDPSGNTVYAGGENGGLWKTTNFLTTDSNGPTWIPLTDNGLPNSLHISTISIIPSNNDPAQQSIIYVGTGDSATGVAGVGFLRSTDGGRTFNLIDSTANADSNTNILPITSTSRDHLFSANTTYVNQISVDPVRLANGEFVIYAALGGSAATQGLWRSIDSGRDWTRVQGGSDCTSIVLAPNRFDLNSSGVPVLRTADVAYAAFSGAGGGVYFTTQISVATSMTLLTGGNGKPLFSNSFTTITVGNSGTNPNQSPTRILLAVPNASANSDPLAAAIYQGWLYAYVIGGGAPGLYMTKDYGANWTFVQINQFVESDGSIVTTNDATQAAYALGADNRYNSLAIDPTNPNVIYLAGTAGILRVDVSAVLDAHAQIRYDNSLGGVGAQSQTSSVGGVNDFNGFGFNFNTDYFNRLRDPNNPFLTNSSQVIKYVGSFVNTGTGAMASQFTGFYDNTLFRDIITVTDALTHKTRLIVATERGIYTAVDAADPNPTQGLYANAKVDKAIGAATSVYGQRNGNLSLLDGLQTAVQPSELAAQLAGLYNALLKDGFGNPRPASQQNSLQQEWIYTVAKEAYVNAWPGILKPGDTNYGNTNWNGVIQNNPYQSYSGYTQTDPQGSGTIYQYRPAAYASTAGGTVVDLAGNSTDIFLVTLPGQSPIGRSNGLFVNGDTVTSGEWNTTQTAYFAVNQADANGIVISAPIGGQVFLTTNQGVNWFSIGAASIFGNSQGTALAFGGRIPSSPSANSFIYDGTASGNVFVTFTGGGGASSWTNISNGLPAGSPILKIIADPKVGTYDAYAITANGVYYKADARTTAAWVNITGNLFSISKPLFGQATTQPILTALTALQVDWRFTQPVLYVAGNSGVFQSVNQGSSWALYPSILGGATVDGGYLPNVSITDLNLVIGNLNTSGVVNQTTGRDILIATTMGRGLYEIQLNANSVPTGLGTSGPFVSSATLVPPNTATGVASFTVNFGSSTVPNRVDPTTLNPAHLDIVAPDGSFLPYTVTDISALVNGVSAQNSFSISFTPPVTGTYQLVMNTGILDTAGRMLNQNQNGVNGENPADNYSQNFSITAVTPPTISSINNQQAVVSAPTGPIGFTVGDAVYPAGSLTVTASSSNTTVLPLAGISLGGSGANRTITITPAAAGVATVTVTVTDGAGRQTSTTFAVSATTVPSLPFSDQFTQPFDSASLSQNWVVQSGTVANSSNSALVTSSGAAVATVSNITQVDSKAQATVTLASAGSGSATLVARYSGSGSSTSMYLGGLMLQNGVLTASILKQVNGTYTTLTQSASLPLSSQYTILFEVVNDSLKLFLNGSLVLFTYDTSITTTGLTGFRLTNGNRLDNYSDDNIVLNTDTFTTNPIVFSNTSSTNGADGTQLDRNWRDRAGNINVVSNAAVGQAAGANLSTYNMPATANVGVQITVNFTGAGQSVGIVQRYNGAPGTADQNMYWGALQSTSASQQQAVIYRNVNGTWTQLSATVVSGFGGTLQFEADGSELKLFVNGVRVLSVYDTTFVTGLVGLRMGVGGSANNVSVYTTSTLPSPLLPFNDTFSTATNNQLATTWTEQAGSFAVNTGTQTVQAQSPGANDATVNGISVANVAVSAVLQPPAGALTAVGLIARYSGAGDTNMYWGALNPITTNSGIFYSAQIWKNVNGTWTNLNANANPITPASVVGQTLLFEVFGSSLKLFLNNTLVSFAFDTSITTAGTVGVRSGNGGTLANFNASADNLLTPGLPYSDSFTAGLNPRNELSANWQERSGFFSVATGNAIGGSAGQTNVAALNGVNAANVTISGSLDFTAAGQSSQLIGRYTGNNGIGDSNYYAASVNTMPNGDALVRILLNNAGTVTVLSSTTITNYFGGTNFAGTATTMQFVINGSSLSVFLNGSGTATLTATDSTLASGSVGIRTNQGAGVGNFNATSP